MDVAQVIFAVALGVVGVIITLFTLYVLSMSVWGATDRWQLRRNSRR